jgi:Trypsin-like peptidase domain
LGGDALQRAARTERHVKNFIRSIVFAVSMLIPALAAAQTPVYGPAVDFQDTLSKATLSVYQGKQICEFSSVDTIFGPMKIWGCSFKRRFTCTATVILKEGPNEYVGLSAGHCIDWEHENDYLVGSSIAPDAALHSIKIVKSENDARYDFVIFRFHSLKELPVVHVETIETVPALGTKVMNVNFALGVGKHYSYGHVSSEPLDDEAFGMKQRFMTSLEIAPGASGSAVVDVETHKIIGLAEFEFNRGNLGAGVIPTGKRFIDFMDDDSAGLKPQPEPKPTTAPDVKSKIIKWFLIALPI